MSTHSRALDVFKGLITGHLAPSFPSFFLPSSLPPFLPPSLPSFLPPFLPFFLTVYFYCIYSITIYPPLYPLSLPPMPVPSKTHTVVHFHDFFLFFAQSCHPPTPPPRAISLLSVYEPVSSLLVRSACSLHSPYE